MQTHDISKDYAEQTCIYEAHFKSSREYSRAHEEKDLHTRYAIRRRYHQDLEALAQMRATERSRLATERGWHVSRRTFTAKELIDGRIAIRHRHGESAGPVIDHPDCFVLDHKPAAIVSHTYAPWEKCVEFAQELGLDAERLEFSWYYPGGTIAVLFTRRVVEAITGEA